MVEEGLAAGGSLLVVDIVVVTEEDVGEASRHTRLEIHAVIPRSRRDLENLR